MSKSARIAIPSSLASRSSLTPPAASSASPRNTPTPPPKWKPQKQAPPRSRSAGGTRHPEPIRRGWVKISTQPHYCGLLRDNHSSLSLFLFHISSRSPQQLVPLLSLRLCVFFFSFNFQLSTFNFPPLPARVQ